MTVSKIRCRRSAKVRACRACGLNCSSRLSSAAGRSRSWSSRVTSSSSAIPRVCSRCWRAAVCPAASSPSTSPQSCHRRSRTAEMGRPGRRTDTAPYRPSPVASDAGGRFGQQPGLPHAGLAHQADHLPLLCPARPPDGPGAAPVRAPVPQRESGPETPPLHSGAPPHEPWQGIEVARVLVSHP